MTPTPHKTDLERAEELDIAAKIAYENSDLVFAKELAQCAHRLRMEAKQDEKANK